jgi:small-conductance mechanosensitive channel
MSDAAPPPAADLTAPLKAVQETATDFSTDIIRWMEQSTLHALLMLGVVIGCGVVLALLRYGLLRLIRWKNGVPARGPRAVVYRLVAHTSVIFLLVLGAWVMDQYLRLPKGVTQGISFSLLLASFYQAGLYIREITLLILERRLAKGGAMRPDEPLSNALGVLGWLVNLCVWSLVLLLLLDNLGVNITALVAGLGIGGLALGLAAQGIISDLFSALSIVFDRPFVRGDFIAFGNKMGTVEKIGLKTSRLRALSGETLIVANNKLLGEIIHNHQQIRERRMAFTFSISYDATPEQLERVPVLVRQTIEAQSNCRFDRAHLISLADNAVVFEAVYFFDHADYSACLDAHQAILLQIMRGLAAEGVAFAVPAARSLQLLASKAA